MAYKIYLTLSRNEVFALHGVLSELEETDNNDRGFSPGLASAYDKLRLLVDELYHGEV